MSVIVGFGELMLRLSSPGFERLFQSPMLDASFGGGEANVCVSCSRFGISARYVSAFPKNALGEAAESQLLGQKVDTSAIAWTGERLGIYFVEKGANQRSSTVIYDRADSSICNAKPEDFNWDLVFKDATWFHISGITPALSQSAADLTVFAVKEAKKRNVRVSCDLNFRKKLWRYGKKSSEVMPEIVKCTDILIANEEDIQLSLGIEFHTDVTKGHLKAEDYKPLMQKVADQYPNLQGIATTLRESISANHNNWSAVFFQKGQLYVSKKYSMTDIVDRVGGGDSFAAGLLSGMTFFDQDSQNALEFAVAASCLKHTIPGDWNLVNKSEVLALMQGDGSGRVQR
ncbi:MAG: PfkB family carbohydrate kinase [Brevinemataceae bacterium]